MDLTIVAGLVSTVLCAMLLWHFVQVFVLAMARGGEDKVVAEEGGGVNVGVVGGGLRRRSVAKRVRFHGVEAVTAEVEGFGNVVESVDGDEGVESAVVEEEQISKSVEDDSESGEMSGLKKVEFWNENVVCSGLIEKVCSAESWCIDESFEQKDGGETQDMDVDDAEGMERELRDEVVERIEECVRTIEGGVFKEEDSVNEGCQNEIEETAEVKDVATRVGEVIGKEGGANELEKSAGSNDVADQTCGVTEEEVSENELEETAGSKDVIDETSGVIEEEVSVNEGYKNELEGMEEPKDVYVEIKDEIAEEKFGSSEEEDDDWEGIEMSELYNDFTAAAALVRQEEKDGKLSNIANDVKMQLYGLQKIVMEGPCREAQPMALKMSARARWNAWQRLGNMNPDDAMKQYIALASGINPECAEQNAEVDDQSKNTDAKPDPDHSKPDESQMKKEFTHNAEDIDTGSSSLHFKD